MGFIVVDPNYQYEREIFGQTVRNAFNGTLVNGIIRVRNRLWARFPKTIYANKEGL